MRTRVTSTGSLTSSSHLFTYKHRSTCGAAYSNASYFTYSGVLEEKKVEDVERSGFQACQKLGRLLPLNPFVISTQVDAVYPYSYSATGRWKAGSCPNQTHYEGSGLVALPKYWYFPEPEPSDAILGAVVNGAVAESRTAAWDGLTFLAELTETKALFRTSVLRLVRFREQLRTGPSRRELESLKDPRKYFEKFSELWLEARYGWLPVYYDMMSALKALNTHRKNTISIGRKRQLDAGSQTITYSGSGGMTHVETLEWSVTYRGWAASEFADDGRVSYDPLVTAYEIATLSFVLDWVIDVGTWLEAISPFQPGKTLGSCGSYQFDISRQRNSSGSNYSDATSNWTVVAPPTLSGSQSIRSYSRFPMATTLPGWNPRITLPRQIDALALASAFANGFVGKHWRL